jgi:hypothetical protein
VLIIIVRFELKFDGLVDIWLFKYTAHLLKTANFNFFFSM